MELIYVCLYSLPIFIAEVHVVWQAIVTLSLFHIDFLIDTFTKLLTDSLVILVVDNRAPRKFANAEGEETNERHPEKDPHADNDCRAKHRPIPEQPEQFTTGYSKNVCPNQGTG